MNPYLTSVKKIQFELSSTCNLLCLGCVRTDPINFNQKKEFIEHNKNASCVYCDNKLTVHNATADHIIPISDGGNNCQVNLVVCCKECNTERGNLEFSYYMSKKNSKKLKYFI